MIIPGIDVREFERGGVATHRFACITCAAVHEYVNTILTFYDALFMVELNGWKVRANDQTERWDVWCPTCRCTHDDWVDVHFHTPRKRVARLHGAGSTAPSHDARHRRL